MNVCFEVTLTGSTSAGAFHVHEGGEFQALARRVGLGSGWLPLATPFSDARRQHAATAAVGTSAARMLLGHSSQSIS